MGTEPAARAGAVADTGAQASRRTGPDWLRLALAVTPTLARLHEVRRDLQGLTDPFQFARGALARLQVSLELREEDLAHIPAQGAAVITANHPYGALDGLAAIEIIGRRRRDLRVLANRELTALSGLGALMIPVDPFGGAAATRANLSGLRRALRWLSGGGVLLAFPAGEVSAFEVRTLQVSDRAWSAGLARLVRLSGAAVVPMHLAGGNSPLFHLAGLLHPRLRTLLLAHELGNKLGARVGVRIGTPLPLARSGACRDDAALALQLRLRTHLLASAVPPAAHGPPRSAAGAPLAAAVEPAALQAEIEALPQESLLLSAGAQRVYCAPATALPGVLRELGRLRERSFRAAGEGTGAASDLDAFDAHYEHLFLWNEATRELVGAYRLAQIAEVLRRYGREGLYTATLFEYHELFFRLLGPALELGRSFVRPEYQKSFAPLQLLWRGIGEYLGRHPRCCKLLGAVSISNDYQPLSRQLLVSFLRERRFDALAPALVRPRAPFPRQASLRSLARAGDLGSLSGLIAGLEPDGKGAPVLLRQYLKLGARALGFSVDARFGDALDCLMLVDLRRTAPRLLRPYLSARARARVSQARR
ncbi:MAG: lysophospholipid acyltransferase family protein [Gammaproteobacteria bacterium]|nr:lysophospholipid acyltransferase family protein [Gammaproteobacteria bacterium]